MCVIKRGRLSEIEGDNMTSQAARRGGGSQLHPDQDSFKNNPARKSVLNRLRTLFQVLGSICFRLPLLLLYSMTFMLVHGEEDTGICKLVDPAINWDTNSVVNFETIGLCPCSSIQQLPTQHMNVCIPHGHLNAENHSPDPLGPPILSRANVKMVMTVLAIIGGIGLVGWVLYKHRPRAFTEAGINRGLASEPAVPRQSDPTFEIRPRIH